MKIIYLVHQFYPEYQTGTEKIVLNNALMAQKFGNKVKIITYSSYEESFYNKKYERILFRNYLYMGIPVTTFRHKNRPEGLNLSLDIPGVERFARKLLIQEKPDIIHVGHSMRLHKFITIAKEFNIPYIMTLTDFFLLCPKVILAPDPFSLCDGPKGGENCKNFCKEFNHNFITTRLDTAKDILFNAEKLIAPSRFVANMFNSEFNQLNIDVIQHGIDYTHIKQNNKSYNQYDQIVFGYAGSLNYHKGVHIILKAMKNIKNKNSRLFLYGSGTRSYLNKLKMIVKDDPRVSFNSAYKTEDLGDIFNSIDILILPSIWYEAYSLVLHEALASNIPVIATELGVMAEKIKSGFNGLTFSPGNHENLRENMELIINEPSLLNEYKNNIHDKIIVPTIEQEAYKYFQIYNSILSNG